MTHDLTGWCMLRMSGPRTLAVARSLKNAGFDAWTPMEVIEKTRPRGGPRYDVELPIMPTFVFVRARQIDDILRVLAMPVSPHPPFSVFRWDYRIPVIGDASFEALRGAEEAAAREHDKRLLQRDRDAAKAEKDRLLAELRRSAPAITVGDRVTVDDDSAWTGMTGVVQGKKGHKARVHFGGAHSVQIDTWLLRPDHVYASASKLPGAAKVS